MTDAGIRRVVLVVDDDETTRSVVRAVVEAEGYDVVEAADGHAALMLLDAINARGPEIVVLDVMMPGIDGVDVCRRVDHDRVKVLMLSAKDDADTRERALAAGAVAYLTKPFTSIDLAEALANAND